MVKNDDDDCKATNSIELGPVGNTRTSNRCWSVLCREKTHHWAIEASPMFWDFVPNPRPINWLPVVRLWLNRCNIRAGHRVKTYDLHGFTLIESCYSICGCSSMVEPQPSKRLRIHLSEKISAQVSPVFFAVKRSQHRRKPLSCQIRAKECASPASLTAQRSQELAPVISCT